MITINDETIEMTINNHKEAADDGNMHVVAELDANMDEIRKLLNKIHYMSDVKSSAASEIIIEAGEHVWDYIKN